MTALTKKKITVSFGQGVTRWNDIIGRALEDTFEVSYVKQGGDLRFVSDTDAAERYEPGCRRILVAIENSWPDFNTQAGGLIFLYSSHHRVLRLPFYALVAKPEELIKEHQYADRVLAEKRRFCCFVASNMNAFRTFKRVDFFKKLHARKKVDSGGKLFNNIGHRVEDLESFYREHRFCLAIENQDWPGYTTEKLVKAMRNGCIPIYWGNKRIHEEFNPRSFINLHAFSSDNAAIEHILKVDSEPELMRQYLAEPFFHHNEPNAFYDHRRVGTYLKKIVELPQPRRFPPHIQHRLFRTVRKAKPYLDALRRTLGHI